MRLIMILEPTLAISKNWLMIIKTYMCQYYKTFFKISFMYLEKNYFMFIKFKGIKVIF